MYRDQALENFYMVKEARKFEPMKMTQADMHFFPDFIKRREQAFKELKESREYRGSPILISPGAKRGMTYDEVAKRKIEIQQNLYESMKRSNPPPKMEGKGLLNVDKMIDRYNKSLDASGKPGFTSNMALREINNEIDYRNPTNIQKRRAALEARVQSEVKANSEARSEARKAAREAEELKAQRERRFKERRKVRDYQNKKRKRTTGSAYGMPRGREKGQFNVTPSGDASWSSGYTPYESTREADQRKWEADRAKKNRAHQKRLNKIRRETALIEENIANMRRSPTPQPVQPISSPRSPTPQPISSPRSSYGGGGGGGGRGRGLLGAGLAVAGTAGLLGYGLNRYHNRNTRR